MAGSLGWALFWIWNLGVVGLGWALVLGGVSQPIEWAEFPIVVDVIVLVALAGYAVQFLPPYFAAPRHTLYVSSWYLLLALAFAPVTYLMGSFVPWYWAPGAQGAAFSGLYIHDAVGLVVTPFALATARRPIWRRGELPYSRRRACRWRSRDLRFAVAGR